MLVHQGVPDFEQRGALGMGLPLPCRIGLVCGFDCRARLVTAHVRNGADHRLACRIENIDRLA